MTMNLIAAVRGLVREKTHIKTRSGVYKDLIEYLDFLAETFGNHDPQISDLTVENIERFKNVMSENAYAGATIRRRLGSLKQLGSWLYEQGLIPKPLKIAIPLKGRHLPKGMTMEQEAEVRRLGFELLMGGEKGLKEKEAAKKKAMGCLVIFLLETGLRIDEAANVMRVQIKDGMLVSVRGKGGSIRDVNITHVCAGALAKYLASRRDNDPRIFKGVDSTLFRWVKEVGNMLGMLKPNGKCFLHPHKFRHTFAHGMLRKTNNNLRHVMTALGHKNIETTAGYTEPSNDVVADAMNIQEFASWSG